MEAASRSDSGSCTRSRTRRVHRRIGEVEIDTALVEYPDHLLLGNPATLPAVAPGPDVDSGLSDRFDDRPPRPVRLPDKGHIIYQGEVQPAVLEMVAGPLTLDDVGVAEHVVFCACTLGGRHHAVETRGPVP